MAKVEIIEGKLELKPKQETKPKQTSELIEQPIRVYKPLPPKTVKTNKTKTKLHKKIIIPTTTLIIGIIIGITITLILT